MSKQFSVICIGQYPNGSGKYIVKKSINVKQIDRLVSEHDTYEEAKDGVITAGQKEVSFSTGRKAVVNGIAIEHRF